MPTTQFINLSQEKKNAIIQAALKEFAESGVINASTNNIVKNCGISKGSLFKYFHTKDAEYITQLTSYIDFLKKGILRR